MKEKSFTLVELLADIAIRAILEALLLPALSRAKAAAKRIDCANNLQKIAWAPHWHASDYEDYLPPIQPTLLWLPPTQILNQILGKVEGIVCYGMSI